MRKTLLMAAMGVLLSLCSSTPALAGFKVLTDRLGYTGTVFRYENFNDALAGHVSSMDGEFGEGGLPLWVEGDITPYNVAQRDAAILFRQDYTGEADRNQFTVAHPYTTQAGTPYSGNGNPNKTRLSLVQIVDEDGSTDSFTSVNFGDLEGGFFHTLNVFIEGGGAGAVDFARIWNGVNTAGSTSLLDSTVYHYVLNMTLEGVNGVQSGDTIVSNSHPTNVTGTFDAIFYNNNTVDTSYNGWYSVHLTLNMTSWAWNNAGSLNGAFRDSYFYVDGVDDDVFTSVPTPTAGLMGLLLLPGLLLRRGRRSN